MKMANTIAVEQDVQEVIADWKNTDELIESFRKALDKLGISMIDHPVFEGSDTLGFIISRAPLTAEEVDEYCDANYNRLPPVAPY